MIEDITQQEKRQVLRNDRRVREASTYHSVAQASIDDERAGRYAVSDSKQTVIGSSPIAYPTQPHGSPWANDPLPPEPPLGFSVDAQEPVGEVFERASTPAASVAGAGDGGVPPSSTIPPKFKRRV